MLNRRTRQKPLGGKNKNICSAARENSIRRDTDSKTPYLEIVDNGEIIKVFKGVGDEEGAKILRDMKIKHCTGL